MMDQSTECFVQDTVEIADRGGPERYFGFLDAFGAAKDQGSFLEIQHALADPAAAALNLEQPDLDRGGAWIDGQQKGIMPKRTD
jgi:hypothetical protein